jgi:hypothetical protein
MRILSWEKAQITQKSSQLTAQEPAWLVYEQERSRRTRGIKENSSLTAPSRGQEKRDESYRLLQKNAKVL